MNALSSSEMAATWLGVAISGIALLVAIISFWKSDRAQYEANSAQRRLVEIEERREQDRLIRNRQAELTASISNADKGSLKIHIRNSGETEARNIQILLDEIPLLEHPAAPKGQSLPNVIGPNSEISFYLALAFGSPTPSGVMIAWDDDSGARRLYRTTLTF